MNSQSQFTKHTPYSFPYPFCYAPLDNCYLPYWGYPSPYLLHSQFGATEPTRTQQFNQVYQKKPQIFVKQEAEDRNQAALSRQSHQKKSIQTSIPVSRHVNNINSNECSMEPLTKKKFDKSQVVIKIEQDPEIIQVKPTNENELDDIGKLISKAFQTYAIDNMGYNLYINALLQSKNIQKEFVYMLDEKMKSFKKSKEQMIKIIIRRVQKFYKTIHRCKRDDRFVKYGGFKSMNTVYLETMFSDRLFVEAFEEIAINFRKEFESENQKKVDTICELIKNQKVKNNKDLFVQILSEKNKMPWPKIWITKMMKNILWMYSNFSKQLKKEDINRILEQQCL